MIEEWRPVVGYEGWYEVSSMGRIKRVRSGKGVKMGVMKPASNLKNYMSVSLYNGEGREARRTKRINRMVAEAFIGPIPDGYEVNHIDLDRANNCPNNLEFITHSENVRHSADLGRYASASRNRSKLSEHDIIEIRDLRGHISKPKLSKLYGMSVSTIASIQSYRTWKPLDNIKQFDLYSGHENE